MKFVEIVKELVGLIQTFKPLYTGSVSFYQINQLLKIEGIKNFEVGDSRYKTVSVETLAKFLRYNIGRIKKYRTRKYDCENFAAVLKGQAALMIPEVPLGIVHVNRPNDKHALNFCVMMDDKKKSFIMYVEPQTNNMFNAGMARRIKKYRPYFAYL